MKLSGAKTMTVVPQYSRLTGLPYLWIRTAAGPKIGFGHLRRSLVLAEALRDACRPVFLLDPGDCWSRTQLEDGNCSFYCDGIDQVWESLPEPDAILIDTRISSGLDGLISAAKTRRIPVISIHDLGLNRLPSDKAIDGSVVPMNPDSLHPNTQYFTGPDYMVLDPIYQALSLLNKPIHQKMRSVLINLGGGDSARFYRKVLEGLKLWAHEIEVIGVPGFSSWGQEELARNDWTPLHFRWDGRNIPQLLFGADLAITAGGISAYEALCAGTPLLTLAYDELQQITIKTLSSAEACIDLGLGDDLLPGDLAIQLSRLEADIAKRQLLSRNGRRIVDGRGTERVVRIILQSISNSSQQMDRGRP